MDERWFFDQDQSSHWYLVPEARRAEWAEWRDIPEDDERAWEAPAWAKRLPGHPRMLSFLNPAGGF